VVASADQCREQQAMSGWTEYVTMNLLPAVLISKITLLATHIHHLKARCITQHGTMMKKKTVCDESYLMGRQAHCLWGGGGLPFPSLELWEADNGHTGDVARY